MNERIDELFGKALDTAVPGTWMTLNPAQLTKLMEKFAELIVRECVGVCDDERDSTDSEFGKLVAEGCALKIMERFGVE